MGINLQSLSADEMKDIIELDKLRIKAQETFNKLNKYLVIPFGKLCLNEETYKYRIEHRSDSNNDEYIVIKEGKIFWEACYLHQHYKVSLTIESIYRIYSAEYFYKKEKSIYVNNSADSVRYFDSFVNSLEKVKA